MQSNATSWQVVCRPAPRPAPQPASEEHCRRSARHSLLFLLCPLCDRTPSPLCPVQRTASSRGSCSRATQAESYKLCTSNGFQASLWHRAVYQGCVYKCTSKNIPSQFIFTLLVVVIHVVMTVSPLMPAVAGWHFVFHFSSLFIIAATL